MTTLADAFDSIFAQFEDFEIPPTEIHTCNLKVKELSDRKLITANERIILAAALAVLATMVARRSGVSMDKEMPSP